MNFFVVAIGRNEGERLRICLESVVRQAKLVVYVDSGSTDNSVQLAQALGCEVVNLDMQQPFTAARARNEGFARALYLASGTPYVQFIDGDCEMVAGWTDSAVGFLDSHPDVAATCGRLIERYPEASIYNRLCDIEWNTPVGLAKACGGIVMMRASALQAAGGFRADLIAGEEPELCVRLRRAGWRIWRLDHDMALHDAAMTRFGQWWNRTKRGGYAFAAGAALHGAPPERHYVKHRNRGIGWGIVLPLLILALALWHPGWLALLLIYPLQVVRLAFNSPLDRHSAWWRSVFLVIGKFAEGLGSLKFFLDRARGKQGALIEYK